MIIGARNFAVCFPVALLFVSACATGDGSPSDEGRGPVAGGAGAHTAGTAAPVAGAGANAGTHAPPPAGGSMAMPTAGTGGCGPDGDGDCNADAAGSGGAAGAAIAGAGGSAGSGEPQPGRALDPNTPTCFEFNNHGQPVAGDTTKYPIGPGEQYVCNHYDVPWNEPAELVSWKTSYDNQQVLHHWLLYSTPLGPVNGAFEPCIGTHLGQDAQLVAGWAVGGNDVDMPEDVGLRMPSNDRSFLLEWHFYNSTGSTQMDGSGAAVCVLPAGTRANTAGMTWLGTENFNGPLGMPPGQVSEYNGTCINDSGAPITIFRLWPHMHQWGRHMTSVVMRATGATEQVFDQPFDFGYQISYPSAITLQPGDSIRSTCRFQNESTSAVAFGPSSNQEMCYQFAFSYPAGALDNGVLSLVGATNTCW
jgi:hypothetical protein